MPYRLDLRFESSGRRYLYFLFCYALLAYVSILLPNLLRLRPIEDEHYDEVSEWMGHGAYLTWLLTGFSATMKTAKISRNDEAVPKGRFWLWKLQNCTPNKFSVHRV